MRHILPALAVLLLWAGCDHRDDAVDGQHLPQRVWNYHGQAEAIETDLLLRVKPENEDALIFQIRIWSPADNRIRIRCTKLGVAFLEGVIEPNSDFQAVLVRSNEYLEGNLRDVQITTTNAQGEVVERRSIPFFNNIDLLVSELKDGPLPRLRPISVDGQVITMQQPDGGDQVRVRVDDRLQVERKEVIEEDGNVALTIDYGRYEEKDGLQRPFKVLIQPPRKSGEYFMKLRTLDVVPSISRDRMTLDVPDDVSRIDVETFIERLGEREADGE